MSRVHRVPKHAGTPARALAALVELAQRQLLVRDLVQELARDASLLAEALQPVDAHAPLRAPELRVRPQEGLVAARLRRVLLPQVRLEPEARRRLVVRFCREWRLQLLLRLRSRLLGSRVDHVVPVLRQHGCVALRIRRRPQEVLRNAVRERPSRHGYESGGRGLRRVGDHRRLLVGSAAGTVHGEVGPLRETRATLVRGRWHADRTVGADLGERPPRDELPSPWIVSRRSRRERLVG